MIDDIASAQLAHHIRRVLTWGNRISLTMLVIGLAAFVIVGEPMGVALFRAGLVTLLATPVARVVVLTLGFLRAREWASAMMSGTVLAILVGSVIVALRS